MLRRELALVTLGSIACFSSAEQLTGSATGADSGGTESSAGESSPTGDDGTDAPDGTDASGTEDEGTDAPESGEADSGEPIGCGPGLRCVPTPPPTWLGPFAVLPRPAVDDFMCPPEFPELVHEAKASPTNIEADCECGDCGGSTPSCAINFAAFVSPQCGGTPVTTQLGSGCNPLPVTMAEPIAFGYQPVVLDQSCATPVAQPPPAVEWEQELVACTGFEPDMECAVGTCWPQLPMMQVCIAREGNDMCPNGWPEKIIAAQDANDNRSCPACQCEVEAVCNERVQLTTDLGCEAAILEMEASVCAEPDGGAAGVEVAFAPEGGCTIVDPSPEPNGSVQLIDPLTLCCQLI